MTPNLDYSKPETWPTGKMVDDPYNSSGMKSWDDGHVTLEDYVIEQANARRHHISMDYAFLSGKINKLTFNGHVLSTVPQYRALYKWVMQHHPWPDYRAETTLECTRANEDNALTTNPDCAGWVGPW